MACPPAERWWPAGTTREAAIGFTWRWWPAGAIAPPVVADIDRQNKSVFSTVRMDTTYSIRYVRQPFHAMVTPKLPSPSQPAPLLMLYDKPFAEVRHTHAIVAGAGACTGPDGT